MKLTFYHAFAAVVAAIIAAVFVFTIGIYGFGWDNALTHSAARFVPWPAAVVEAEIVTLHEVYSTGKDLDRLLEEQVAEILARKMGVRGQDQLAVALLRQKNTAARMRANELLRQIRFGADFVETAIRSSEDEETRYIGGDLGIVPEGEADIWLRDAARDLEPGQVSGIVVSPLGYHILMLVSRSTDGYVHLRHILIRDESWRDQVTTLRQGMRIYVFGKL